MTVPASKIPAGFYEQHIRKLPSDIQEQITESVVAALFSSDVRTVPSEPLELAWFCRQKEFKEGLDKLLISVGPAKACRNRHAVKLLRALNVLASNLLRRHFSNPESFIRLSFDRNNYQAHKRYNPERIGYRSLMAAVAGLKERGYIDIELGFRNPETKAAFQTRIWPTLKLTQLFKGEFGVSEETFEDLPEGETIILKDKNKKLQDYEDTQETRKMRNVLEKYNSLLARSDIKLPSQFLGSAGDYNGYRVDYSAKRYFRVFNEGKFDRGGRFYGPWWQGVPERIRKQILINGNGVVELDYSAMHIHLLYGKLGMNYYKLFPDSPDPYQLEGFTGDDRKVLKFSILIALNALGKSQAARAIREKLGEQGTTVETKYINKLIDQFSTQHPKLEKYLYSGIGLETQYMDSCIAEYIIKKLTAQSIPSLSVHDSFIVEKTHAKLLKDFMIKAFKAHKLESIPVIH